MPASYPSSIKTFVNRNTGDVIQAAHMNDVQDEINAIETDLISGFRLAIRPDSTGNNRDIGLPTARFRDLFLGRTIDIVQGTLTADAKAFQTTATWTNAAVAFIHDKRDITDTASDGASDLAQWKVGANTVFAVRKNGMWYVNGVALTLATLGATSLILRTNNVDKWQVLSAGSLQPAADALYDLGSATNRPVNLWLSADPTNVDHAARKSYVDARGIASVQVFTANGTWTRPAGVRFVVVEVIGGGGGGGGVGTTASDMAGGGGGGGGYASEFIDVQALASDSVTVGAGGAAGDATGSSGGTGGTSSFGAAPLVQATGGAGGTGRNVNELGAAGAGGIGTLGNVNATGQPGGVGVIHATRGYGGVGGGSIYGGGGIAAQSGAGAEVAGVVGRLYGGGGSGAAKGGGASGAAGGAGAAGIVVVWEFK